MGRAVAKELVCGFSGFQSFAILGSLLIRAPVPKFLPDAAVVSGGLGARKRLGISDAVSVGTSTTFPLLSADFVEEQ
jgi:hypothetical protein